MDWIASYRNGYQKTNQNLVQCKFILISNLKKTINCRCQRGCIINYVTNQKQWQGRKIFEKKTWNLCSVVIGALISIFDFEPLHTGHQETELASSQLCFPNRVDISLPIDGIRFLLGVAWWRWDFERSCWLATNPFRHHTRFKLRLVIHLFLLSQSEMGIIFISIWKQTLY